MSQSWGIDFAWSRPTVGALLAGGVKFVGRYFSHDASKNLTPEEAASYRKHGIGIVVAWESTATRASEGQQAGEVDARAALAWAFACGFDGPIDFAVDFDANPTQIYHYFVGVRRVAAHRAGVYAGYRVVKYLFDNNLISHAWQTYAWSGGQWDHRAAIRQYSNDHVFAGASCDYDVALGPVVHHVENPLNVLIPSERRAANSLLAYRHHPRAHRHGLNVTHALLVRLRKQLWNAAERGVSPSGKRTPKGWGIRNRHARYALLWKLTS